MIETLETLSAIQSEMQKWQQKWLKKIKFKRGRDCWRYSKITLSQNKLMKIFL